MSFSFFHDMDSEYERTGSVEKACSLTFLSEDDIQELVEEYGEDLVTAGAYAVVPLEEG